MLDKLKSLLEALNGKGKFVVAVSVVVIALAIAGVKYGYISEDMVDVKVIVSHISELFESKKVPVVDSVVVDIVDTVSNIK